MRFIQFGVVSIWLIICLYYIQYSIHHRNLKSLKFITIAFMLQNLMSLFASNTLPGIVGQFIILYKEVILWGTVLAVFLAKRKIKESIIPTIFFILYLFVCMFNGNSNMYTKLICFRQLMTPVILVLYGRTLRLSSEEKYAYMRYLVNIGVFQALFGLVERFILGNNFWLNLNVSKLFETKGFSKWVLSGLPGNYYSYDFYHIIGKSVRRLVGITTDPLLTAHFLALCIVILLFTESNNKIKKYLELLLLTIATILTLSKGAILIIGVAYLYKIWVRNRVIALGGIAVALAGVVAIIQSNLLRTVTIHLAGFSTELSNLSLIGGGFGVAGNLSSLSGSSSTSGESYFGMVLGQIGIIGLLLFIWMIFCLIKMVLKIDKGRYEYAVIAYIIGVMVEAVMSESAINFVGSGYAFILLGIFTNKTTQDKLQNCYLFNLKG